MNDRHAPYSCSTVSTIIFVTSSTLSRIAQLKTQLVLWLVNEAPMSFYMNSGWAQVGDAAWDWCLGGGVMLMLCLANGGKPGHLEYTTCVWPNRTLVIKIKKKLFSFSKSTRSYTCLEFTTAQFSHPLKRQATWRFTSVYVLENNLVCLKLHPSHNWRLKEKHTICALVMNRA